MNTIAASFASLVKFNNGFFKSDKQRDFLLSQCFEGVYQIGGDTYGNSYAVRYVCDELGVICHYVHYFKTSRDQIKFERGQFNAVSEKALKRAKAAIETCKEDLRLYDESEVEELDNVKEALYELGGIAKRLDLFDSSAIGALNILVKAWNDNGRFDSWDYSEERSRVQGYIEKNQAIIEKLGA